MGPVRCTAHTGGMPPDPVLAFLGAARTVTGSKTLLDTGTHRVLVDAGLFQGRKELRLRNREPFPVAPASIRSYTAGSRMPNPEDDTRLSCSSVSTPLVYIRCTA